MSQFKIFSAFIFFLLIAAVCALSSTDELSPIYEEMWANEIIQLRKQMIHNDDIGRREPFGFINVSAPFPLAQIVPILKEKHADVHWELRDADRQNKSFSG